MEPCYSFQLCSRARIRAKRDRNVLLSKSVHTYSSYLVVCVAFPISIVSFLNFEIRVILDTIPLFSREQHNTDRRSVRSMTHWRNRFENTAVDNHLHACPLSGELHKHELMFTQKYSTAVTSCTDHANCEWEILFVISSTTFDLIETIVHSCEIAVEERLNDSTALIFSKMLYKSDLRPSSVVGTFVLKDTVLSAAQCTRYMFLFMHYRQNLLRIKPVFEPSLRFSSITQASWRKIL